MSARSSTWVICTACLATFLVCTVHAATVAAAAGTPIPGIGPTGDAVEIDGTFKFTEGPAADAAGVVYFTDVPNNKVYKVEPGNKSALVRDNSNRTNGQVFNAAGEIICCQRGGIAAVTADGRSQRMLATEYGGKPFNGPNDLALDRAGGVYFSDPSFNVGGQPSNQGVSGVYYVAPDGKVTRIVDNVVAPNGVRLSPDEKTLYVIPTVRAEIMAFPIESPGKLGAGRVFCTLKPKAGSSGAGGDGAAVDVRGNLYIATGAGLQVFDASGQPLGTIELAKPPSNCAFGGPDFKTLYVTARTSVYALPMAVAGHRFPGGLGKK
ncbi:MAG: SMP-30/gluconolactonase/LRE family protein [Planctomycetia bacterium]|nr:SMP-30/gluconolactonase/LRE family protein [Planctomycetia bacterium]